MKWVRARKLGHGSFATVSLAVPRSQNTPLMAVKTCSASRASTLLNEKSVLEELKDCPEIIRCYGDCFTHENGQKSYNLLLEYAPNGTLHDKLKTCIDQGLSESEVRHYTKAMLKGLRQVHDNGYVHCDMKLQNILLFPDGGLKIADFGLAKKLGSISTGELMRGTPLYMSPELLAAGDQGTAADVWALGCIIVEMLTGAPAWNCSNLAELVVKMGACNRSKQSVTEEIEEDIIGNNSLLLSDVAKDFINKCMVKDPRDRWTAEMLLRHPFVSGVDDYEDYDHERSVTNNCISDVSISPRCVFDFPEDDCVLQSSPTTSLPSMPSCSGSSASSAILRVKELDCGHQSLDWSASDDWVTIR